MIPRMMLLSSVALAITDNAFGQPPLPFPFVQPLAGTNNVDWTIVNYMDLDPTHGLRDYTGATGNNAFTYNGHDAVDYTLPNFAAMERGVPVFAAAAGTVSEVVDLHYDRCTNNCNGNNGNRIKITHPNGVETWYWHLARNSTNVNVGDMVTAGQQIALVGSSGDSSDVHLHFETRQNGTAIEPYLNPAASWVNPLPYAGNGVRVIDSGFTHLDPSDPQLRDRPSDNDVFYQSDGAGQLARMWLQMHSLDTSDTINYRLFRPNGTQFGSFNSGSALDRWGWQEIQWNLPNTLDAGVWTTEVRANGGLIATKTFTVVAAPQTRSWTAGSGPIFWNSATNWSGSTVPGAGEDVRIVHSDGINRTVVYNRLGGPTLKSLTLDLTGPGTQPAVFINGGFDISLIDGLVVGENGRAQLDHSGGRMTTANPNLDVGIGRFAGSDGVYNMSNNAALHVARGLYLGAGDFASGKVNQTGGTTTSGASTILGNGVSSVGQYNLSGGTLNVGDTLYVGSAGNGVLNVTGRSQVLTYNGATLGYYGDSIGTMTLDGNRTFWDTKPGGTGRIVVGREGLGTLNIRNGATVNSESATLGESSVGAGFRHGIANVGDGGGTWNIANSLLVGEGGRGNLNLQGGTINADRITIGQLTGSDGRVVISDVSFGSLNSDNSLAVGESGAGALTVGSWATVTNTAGFVGLFGNGNGAVTVSGTNARWNNSDFLQVGGLGTGTLTVSNAGRVTNTVGFVGHTIFGTGAVTVTGAGSQWNNSEELYVGNAGDGTLTVSNAGGVTNSRGYVGHASGSTGNVTVTGFGSYWNNSGDLYVGKGGNGTLSIADAAVVTSTNGYVGRESSSTSAVTVNGGQMHNFGPLYVGYEGTGTLTISNAGSVQSLIGFVGTQAGSTGTATVSGGSQWAISDNLNVGRFGTGTLNLANGGTVSVVNLTVVDAGGEINNTGGSLVSNTVINQVGGEILGQGQFSALGGWSNSGEMVFSAGTSNVYGPFTNRPGGVLGLGDNAIVTFHGNVVHNGSSIALGSGSDIRFQGGSTGSGNYTGSGTVKMDKDFRPGSSPGVVSFGGNLNFGSANTTYMELAGVSAGQFDQVLVGNTLTLGGALDVSLLGGYMPAAGAMFNLFDWGALSGTFTSINLPSLASGLTWNTSQLYTTGTLSVVIGGIPGDYNNNGSVDAADYTAYRDALGSNTTLPNDATPGSVTAADYTVWQTNFGQGGPSAAGVNVAAVPEASSVLLLMLALAARGLVCRLAN